MEKGPISSLGVPYRDTSSLSRFPWMLPREGTMPSGKDSVDRMLLLQRAAVRRRETVDPLSPGRDLL